MKAQGIYLNFSRRNDDLPQLIEEYSEKFNLSKADTVAEILRAYPKLIAYKQKVMEEERRVEKASKIAIEARMQNIITRSALVVKFIDF